MGICSPSQKEVEWKKSIIYPPNWEHNTRYS